MYAGSKTSKTKIEEKENMTLEALAQDIRADHARNDLCFIEPYHTDADVVENSLTRRCSATMTVPTDRALNDVAAHRRTRVLHVPPAASFLEYVQGAVEAYRDARQGEWRSRVNP